MIVSSLFRRSFVAAVRRRAPERGAAAARARETAGSAPALEIMR